MKFSWKMLKYFINLEFISFEKVIKYLTIAGFEVENIENETIQINITNNRKEINCIFNLANEISIILDIPLKNPNLYILKKENKIYSNSILNNSTNIIYFKINVINRIRNTQSPPWLQNYLQISNIQPKLLLQDIQAYIKLKWGQEIILIDTNKLNLKNLYYKDFQIINKSLNKETIKNKDNELIYITNSKIKLNLYYDIHNNSNNIIICYVIHKKGYKDLINFNTITKNIDYDIIRIITTFGKGIINKNYEEKKIFIKLNNTINIKKNYIKQILGPLNDKDNNKLLSNQQIHQTLQQLKIQYQYCNKEKKIITQIPMYRQHDLNRDIDVIEEIARIQGFEKFIDKLPNYVKKGNISLKKIYIKKIRNISCHMGFNEVISCTLINKKKNTNIITIYNPILEDQCILRNNILENLINKYKEYSKQKNNATNFFEIGQIFYHNKQKKYQENTHLAGLIYKSDYIKKNWSIKEENLIWPHAKNNVEHILRQLNTYIKWQTSLNKCNNRDNQIKNIERYFHKYNKIYIYNPQEQEVIGIFGEINYYYLNSIDKQKVFIFEINIDKLLKTIYFKKHLNYIKKPYSLYPYVTRDITINITRNTKIETIKKLILQQNLNNKLIESIELINEYYNKINKNRSICFRIIYRSFYKTLNTKDLKYIDAKIANLLLLNQE